MNMETRGLQGHIGSVLFLPLIGRECADEKENGKYPTTWELYRDNCKDS